MGGREIFAKKGCATGSVGGRRKVAFVPGDLREGGGGALPIPACRPMIGA